LPGSLCSTWLQPGLEAVPFGHAGVHAVAMKTPRRGETRKVQSPALMQRPWSMNVARYLRSRALRSNRLLQLPVHLPRTAELGARSGCYKVLGMPASEPLVRVPAAAPALLCHSFGMCPGKHSLSQGGGHSHRMAFRGRSLPPVPSPCRCPATWGKSDGYSPPYHSCQAIFFKSGQSHLSINFANVLPSIIGLNLQVFHLFPTI
jgi:hypothetical protein